MKMFIITFLAIVLSLNICGQENRQTELTNFHDSLNNSYLNSKLKNKYQTIYIVSAKNKTRPIGDKLFTLICTIVGTLIATTFAVRQIKINQAISAKLDWIKQFKLDIAELLVEGYTIVIINQKFQSKNINIKDEERLKELWEEEVWKQTLTNFARANTLLNKIEFSIYKNELDSHLRLTNYFTDFEDIVLFMTKSLNEAKDNTEKLRKKNKEISDISILIINEKYLEIKELTIWSRNINYV